MTIKEMYNDGIFALAQLILLLVGFLFTAYQLRLARRSFQATVISQITDRSSNLQWDVMKDPELQSLLVSGGAGAAKQKRDIAAGRIINNFASIFDLWQLGGMPKRVWRTFEIDLRVLLSRPDFVERWQELRGFHNRKFIRLVEKLIAKNAKAEVVKAVVEPASNQNKGEQRS
jgi:hypothetical protein